MRIPVPTSTLLVSIATEPSALISRTLSTSSGSSGRWPAAAAVCSAAAAGCPMAKPTASVPAPLRTLRREICPFVPRATNGILA
jgi:hypothetical protein